MMMSDPLPDLSDIAAQSHTKKVWLRVGTIIDGVSNRPLRDADIVFDAKQIHFVGLNPSRDVLPEGQKAPTLKLPACTVLPCLIEAHAHMFLDGAPVDFQQRDGYLRQSGDWMLERAKARWPKILAQGIGAVRDAGDKHGVGLALALESKQQSAGLRTTPYIDSPGSAIHHKGRYGSFMGEPIEDYPGPAECVAGRIENGADRIKLLVSGIINFKVGEVTTPPQMPVEEVKALVEAAKSHGKQTFAHASGTEGVENSIEGGVNTVEHGFFITVEQLKKMRDRKTAWVPTFAPVQLQIDRAKDLGWDDTVVGHLKRIIESHQTMLCKAHEMGVLIVAGSDAGSCGVPHAIGLLDELCQMERAGMPPIAVIRSATGRSSDVLDFPEPIGKLMAGSRSRIIFTTSDPLKTVEDLRKPKTILFDGAAIKSDSEMSLDGL